MTFLYPIGLLGLIGVPIFIIVYLIKNRYTEQTIASTYMWTLSERFIKRRNPFSRFTGIISLILQLLLVTVLSFAIAHPIVTLPGKANEYCFILDASASMNMEEGGETRFDAAKEEIEQIINDSKRGSTFTLVVVDDSTDVVFERIDDKEKAVERLMKVECSDSISDNSDALGIAQTYFNANPSLVTYLVTDADYTVQKNVTVINVARGGHNVSLDDVSYYAKGDGTVYVSGSVTSFGADSVVDVNVFADDSTAILGSTQLNIAEGESVPFTVTLSLARFNSLTISIVADDAYDKDNVAKVYSESAKNSYKALIVSDTPFFLESVLNTVGGAEVVVMSTEDYIKQVSASSNQDKKMSGYSLYIFDAINPIEMPNDGSVWLVGVNSNVEDSGFSVQGEISFEDGSEVLTLTSATSSTVRKLTDGMTRDAISVAKYIKCSPYTDFTTIYSYLGNPVVFTGLNAYGNREVVISFNLHDSNFVLSLDFVILTRNLLDFSFPEIIEVSEYYCGDTAEVNVISGCESIRVQTPSGNVMYTDISGAVSEFVLTEVGEYKLNIKVSGAEKELYIYSSVPKEERATSGSFESVSINGEAVGGGTDGKLDLMVTLFIAAAMLFTAEWMVYCYDKYQLR